MSEVPLYFGRMSSLSKLSCVFLLFAVQIMRLQTIRGTNAGAGSTFCFFSLLLSSLEFSDTEVYEP